MTTSYHTQHNLDSEGVGGRMSSITQLNFIETMDLRNYMMYMNLIETHNLRNYNWDRKHITQMNLIEIG